jgi:hypothetical protein
MVQQYRVTPLLAPAYSPLDVIKGPAKFIELLDSVVERLASRGLRPPPNSRLHQARDALLAPINGNQIGFKSAEEAFRCTIEAYRVTLEFLLISRSVTAQLSRNPRIMKLVQRSFAGRLDPQSDDQTSQRARDAQFELWLGSWFAMGGRPVQAIEPDLRVALWFRWYDVAAKRVRARGQLLTRVQKAAAQIRAAGKYGIVGLSLDNYSDTLVETASGVQPGSTFFEKFTELERIEAWLLSKAPWVKATFCFGFLGSSQLPPDGTAKIEITSLERVMLLNIQEPENGYIVDVLAESRDRRHERWAQFG